MTAVVLDASACVHLLSDRGPVGVWVTAEVSGAALLAPSVMPFETANILRRHLAAGILDRTSATAAHIDLAALRIDLWPYHPALADRAWQLRENLTIYDASYAAVAELTGARLVTLDGAFAAVPGRQFDVSVAPT